MSESAAAAQPALWACGAVLLVHAASTDIRWRRVGNGALASAAAAALGLHAWYAGAYGLAAAAVGAAAGAVWWIPVALFGLGAGDAKLAMAIGALWGPRVALLGPAAGMCALAVCLPGWILVRCVRRLPWRGQPLPVAPWIGVGAAVVAAGGAAASVHG